VSLEKLYQLEDAINNNSNNLYSPVILRIVDPEILQKHGCDEQGRLYSHLM
jgi:hypothetical protein